MTHLLQRTIRQPRFCARIQISVCAAAAFLLIQAFGAQRIQDFTFIQASDVHTPMAQSKATIAQICGLGEISLQPFHVEVPRPAFVLVTGDLTEFGGGNGWWNEYLSYWSNCPFPIRNELGNHDNTWRANIKSLRETGAAPCYSFDYHGCHFAGLMTATPQDPRPSIGEEEINWLKQDLRKLSPEKPVFVFFHHPLGGTEFASRYDYDRLLDVLREHNTVLLMAGHSHGHVYRPVLGMDQITGGSTFGRTAGFAVISVKDGMLRAAYCKAGESVADEKLLEKPLPVKSSIPRVHLDSPGFRASFSGRLQISATLDSSAAWEGAHYSIDDESKGGLDWHKHAKTSEALGTLALTNLLPGAHYLRVEFYRSNQVFSRSTEFFFDPPGTRLAWRAYLGASGKAAPALAEGLLCVGANDGVLHLFNARNGKELWHQPTGAEILAQPLILGHTIFCANGLGVVSAYSSKGKRLWSFTADDAVYSSPVVAEGKLVFGCNDGKLYALDLATGKQVWVNSDATYAVESAPVCTRGKIYYGAWDEQVRCVSAADGKLLWKRVCEGSRVAKAAKRYYSPADAAPVLAGGNVLIADRNYMLTILNADTGEPVGTMTQVAATGLSEDGRFVYLRKTDGDLAKIDPFGKEIWRVPAQLGAIPTAPMEKNGLVFVCSAKGTVSALSAETGKALWQYQASPQLYVMSPVMCDGVNAYVTAFDGTLTAIALEAEIR